VPDGLLAGKRALVTGAARGIGLGIARRFCEEGASVALSDVLVPEVDAAVSELSERGHAAIGVPFDVADEEAVEAGVREARDRLGGLDVLVANAGILRVVPALETSVETWRRILDVNLTGVFLCLRAAGRLFVEQRHGVLLATASQAGRHGYRGEAAYCASKFGVVGLVEVMAKELAGFGVRVNAVAPGTIRTQMEDRIVEGVMARTGSDAASAQQWLLDTIPLGRPGTPDEVGDAFVYLASDLSTYVSGATLVIDGGECS
jgi:NAD(P)-dependent dehydrogenase (short-subunit alcohol dehydrogenase family)